ncbi:MAG: transporter substrate-binding domain-containing protein [Burkholderiales bacterium]|nr:transporter substrate-binding domain-containing protein [Burkholderiales bacterium]
MAWRPSELFPALCTTCVLALGLAMAARAQQTLRAGVYDNPPKVTAPASGRPGGIYVQVLDDVAAREGWRVTYVPGTFQEGLDRLERGTIDVMVDVARTPERERTLDFTNEAVLLSWNEVYARRGSDIRNLLDLQGRRVAVLASSVQEKFLLEAVRSFGVSPVIVRFESFEDAFEAVRKGVADAVVANPFFGNTHLRGLEDTSILFGPTTLHFAVRQGTHGALIAALDRRLAELRADPGSYFFREQQRLLRVQSPDHIPPWLVPAVAAFLAALVLAIGWAYTLRRDALRLRAALRALEDRGVELERANGDLQIVGYSLSHDLRSPLAAVQGFVQAVQHNAGAVLGGKEVNYLARSLAAAQRMDRMVRELATLLKLAGEPLRMEACDLSALAQDVVASLHERFETAPRITIAAGMTARADPGYMRIALENLLANAWKFSAAVTEPAIEVGRQEGGGRPVFFVRDNGAGFEMAQADRLFRPFSRLHSESEFPGTGIGLSIVHRVVTRHGGRIWAEAAPQQGATFYFTLA